MVYYLKLKDGRLSSFRHGVSFGFTTSVGLKLTRTDKKIQGKDLK